MLTNRWRYIILVVGFVFCASPAMAARLMDAPAVASQKVWLISDIDLHHRVIEINDKKLHIAKSVKVHLRNHKRGSLKHLRVGMQVGYRLKKGEDGGSEISEIWVSP